MLGFFISVFVFWDDGGKEVVIVIGCGLLIIILVGGMELLLFWVCFKKFGGRKWVNYFRNKGENLYIISKGKYFL